MTNPLTGNCLAHSTEHAARRNRADRARTHVATGIPRTSSECDTVTADIVFPSFGRLDPFVPPLHEGLCSVDISISQSFIFTEQSAWERVVFHVRQTDYFCFPGRYLFRTTRA